MRQIEALKLALKQESSAIELYRNLATENPEIKDLLFELLNEEEKHKKLIEQRIAALTK